MRVASREGDRKKLAFDRVILGCSPQVVNMSKISSGRRVGVQPLGLRVRVVIPALNFLLRLLEHPFRRGIASLARSLQPFHQFTKLRLNLAGSLRAVDICRLTETVLQILEFSRLRCALTQ